jgi:hypothetical protein
MCESATGGWNGCPRRQARFVIASFQGQRQEASGNRLAPLTSARLEPQPTSPRRPSLNRKVMPARHRIITTTTK